MNYWVLPKNMLTNFDNQSPISSSLSLIEHLCQIWRNSLKAFKRNCIHWQRDNLKSLQLLLSLAQKHKKGTWALTRTKKKKSQRKQKIMCPFVKHSTMTTPPYGPYGSTNNSRTNSFLKLFNKFKSVFRTMSAIHIRSVTAVLRWIWEDRNLKENNTIKVCLKHQVPIDPFAHFSNTLWT